MSKVVTLQINGQDVSGNDDESILDVARSNGIFIPTLCHLEGLSEVGACRLCLVEIRGISKLQPACTAMANEGMVITTNSERLIAYRKTIVEMLFAEGNHICSVCVTNGHCELQNLAVSMQIDHVSMAYRNPKRNVDITHKWYGYDGNRCVLCTRCIRVCDEIEGAHTWDMMNRGVKSRVITDMAQPWGESDTCTSCGKCVQVCPTGALFEKGKAVAEMSKRTEFLPYLTAMRSQNR
ncbi:MAG TPA: bidirectional hydrogenase complex protein HoxU [Aggregatilineales bacterium]|nr:bidirectional hydrogenase complex protein HoxU [Aggregatilineales bacterium]